MCFSAPKIPKPPAPPPPAPEAPEATATNLDVDTNLVSDQAKAARLGVSQLRIPMPGVGSVAGSLFGSRRLL